MLRDLWPNITSPDRLTFPDGVFHLLFPLSLPPAWSESKLPVFSLWYHYIEHSKFFFLFFIFVSYFPSVSLFFDVINRIPFFFIFASIVLLRSFSLFSLFLFQIIRFFLFVLYFYSTSSLCTFRFSYFFRIFSLFFLSLLLLLSSLLLHLLWVLSLSIFL